MVTIQDFFLEHSYEMLFSCTMLIVCCCLILQFLGTLVDNDTLVRSAARKILRLIKQHDLKMFKSLIDGLLENLKECPQVFCSFI